MVDEGLLHRMQRAVLGQALDGGDLGAVLHHGKGQARNDAPFVDQHRAGAALAVVAALLGASQIEIFAERIKQSRPGSEGNTPLDAIDTQHDVELRRQRKLAPVLPVIAQRHPDLPLASADRQNHISGMGVPAKIVRHKNAIRMLPANPRVARFKFATAGAY